MTVYDNAKTWVGCAIETVRGTPAAAPVFWVPAIVPRVESQIKELEDTGDRGQMTEVWDMVQGPRWEMFTMNFLVHPDILPHIFRSILGSTDTVTAGPSGSYYHAMSLLGATNQGQPPSYTWFDFDGLHLRTIRGCQTDTLMLRWQATGLVMCTLKVLGYQTAVAAPSGNPVMPAIQPVTSWDVVPTFAGVNRQNVTYGHIELARHCQVISTLGQQFPYSVWAGPLSVRGAMAFLNMDDTELNEFLSGQAFTFNLACGSPGNAASGFTIDMASVKASLGFQERNQTNNLINTNLDIVPLPNTTDSTSGGVSPLKTTVQNFTSSAY